MSLQQQLDQTVETVRSAVPPEIFGAIGQSIQDLKQTGQDQEAAGVGAKFKLGELKSLEGQSIDLDALLSTGPLVLIFYRGGWCPYCNVTLKAFADHYPEFEALDATLVAITPELAVNAENTSEKSELPFPIVIDTANAFARKFGLVFSLPSDLRPLYRQIGIDLEAWNGDTTHELPIPATYLIDQSGEIRWAFVEADFTKRADPVDVLTAVEEIA